MPLDMFFVDVSHGVLRNRPQIPSETLSSYYRGYESICQHVSFYILQTKSSVKVTVVKVKMSYHKYAIFSGMKVIGYCVVYSMDRAPLKNNIFGTKARTHGHWLNHNIS